MRDMGLGPGSHVHISYLTLDGQHNSFQEFLLSANPLDNLSDEQQIRMPDHLLEQSNIPLDDDLQIISLDGMLLICRDTVLTSQEITAVSDSFQTAANPSNALPSEAKEALIQMEEIIASLQEGAESSEV